MTSRAGFDPARLSRIDAFVQEHYIDSGKLPHAQMLVARGGEIAHFSSLGPAREGAAKAIDEGSLFRIASMTKPVTSVAALMLMEEGKLVLEDPLGKFLPEWSKTTVAVANPKAKNGYDVVPAKRPVTICDLLSHTAGISYGTGPGEKAWKDAGVYGWYFADKSVPVSEVVAKMAKLPMAAIERLEAAEQIDAVAQGRVWTGAQALEHGLIDRLGNFQDAVKEAAKLAKLPETAPLRYIEEDVSRWQKLMAHLRGEAQAMIGQQTAAQARALTGLPLQDAQLQEAQESLRWMLQARDARGQLVVHAHCMCQVN